MSQMGPVNADTVAKNKNSTTKPIQIDPALEQDILAVADFVGEFMQYWGFKKMHGQVWALIFLAPEPIQASDIVKRLGVSKALVSFAVNELLSYKVIEQCGKGPKRSIKLRSNPDMNQVIINVLEMRELKILKQTLESIHKLKVNPLAKTGSVNTEALNELERMTSNAFDALELLMASKLATRIEVPGLYETT